MPNKEGHRSSKRFMAHGLLPYLPEDRLEALQVVEILREIVLREWVDGADQRPAEVVPLGPRGDPPVPPTSPRRTASS